MFALAVAVAATILLTPASYAQSDISTHKYTVWSSVIFSRTGERTPELLPNTSQSLTSLGAQQQYDVGTFFRERYLQTYGSTNGIDSAPIQDMSVDELDGDQLYVMALDQQYNVASAQAFLQGLYPPYSLSNNTSGTLDPSGLDLANGTYIDGPMSGYQYAQIHTADAWDIEYPFLGGQIGCPAWTVAAQDYFSTPSFLQTQVISKSIYSSIGPVLLSDVLVDEAWDYFNAYAIYDYVNYLNTHNTTAASLLSDPRYINSATNVSYLDTLRWLADEQQYAWLGNMDAQNNLTGQGLPGETEGSISTIAGNMLAAKLLSQLQVNVQTGGQYYKLNLLFGDYQPLMSFFALAQLPPLNSHFYGLPDFASVAAFELFSYTTNETDTDYPSEEDLWVRFWFRNGTDSEEDFLAYSLFNYGPSSMDISWVSFQDEMYKIMVSDVGDWCTQCGAPLLFCAAWNSSNAVSGLDYGSSGGSGRGVSPAVAGVIGAIVTLVIAGLVFGLAMLLGGVRLHRVPKGHKSDLGGFKGGHKMRSDQDLVIPKGGAVVGATVASPSSPTGGHERVGSWELKGSEAGLPNIGAAEGQMPRRPSFEDDDISASPFRDPVKADERV